MRYQNKILAIELMSKHMNNALIINLKTGEVIMPKTTKTTIVLDGKMNQKIKKLGDSLGFKTKQSTIIYILNRFFQIQNNNF